MLQLHSNNSACSLWYAICLIMNCILKCKCRANAAKMTKSTAASGQENYCVENLIWLIAFRWAITNFTKTMFDIYHTWPVDDISVNIKLIRHTGKTQNSIFKILFQSCLVNVSQISAWGETDRDVFNTDHPARAAAAVAMKLNYLPLMRLLILNWKCQAVVLLIDLITLSSLVWGFWQWKKSSFSGTPMHNATAVGMQCNRFLWIILCSCACHTNIQMTLLLFDQISALWDAAKR